MAISVICGGCKAKYSVADSLAGKRAKCQKCGTSFQVPSPEEDLPVLEPVESSEGLKPLSDFGNEANDDLFGSSDPLSSNPFDMPTKSASSASSRGSSGYSSPAHSLPAPSPLGYQQQSYASGGGDGASTGASVVTAIFSPIVVFCLGLFTCILLLCGNPMLSLLLMGLGVVACIACIVLGVVRKPGFAWITCGVYGLLCVLGLGKMGFDVAFAANRIRNEVAQRQQQEMTRNGQQPWNNPVPPPPTNWNPSPPPVATNSNTRPNPPAYQPSAPSGWKPPAENNNAQGEPQFDDWQVVADPLADWAKVGEGPPLAITLYEPAHEGVRIPRAQGRAIAVTHRVGSQDTLEVWDLGSRKKVGQLVGRNEFDRGYTISPDGKYIAGKLRRDGDEVLEVWSVEKRQKASTIDVPRERFHDLYFEFTSPTTLVTMTGDSNKTDLRVWDAVTGSEKGAGSSPHSLGREENTVLSAGRRYLVQTNDGLLVFWDLNTQQTAGRVRLPRFSSFQSCAFSPDGKEILLAYESSGKSHLACCDMATHAIHNHVVFDTRQESPFRSNFGFSDPVRCSWLPGEEGWLVGADVILRKDGSRKWQVPKTLASGGPAVLYDSKQLLTQVKDNQSLVLELKPFPFELMDKSAAAVAAGGTELDALLPPLGRADWSGVKDLSLSAGGPWKYVPSARPAMKTGAGNKAITLTSDRLENLLFSDPQAAQGVMVDVDHESPQHQDLATSVRSRLVRFDLVSGKAAAQLKIPGGSELMAVSPSGQQAILSIGKEDGRLDLYSLGEAPEHLTAWRPYGDEPTGNIENMFNKQWTRQSVAWAGFVEENKLLTLSRMDGQLVLWKLPERQAIYRLRTGSKGRGALSPGRKFFATQAGSAVSFFDVATGEQVGELPLPFEPASPIEHESSLAFSPDGARLACIVGDAGGPFLVAFDLKAGKTIAELPAGPAGTRAQWVGDRQLLTYAATNFFGGINYLDLDRRAVAWRFLVMGGYKLSSSPDDRVWLVADHRGDSDKVLLAQPFQPPPEVRNALAAMPVNPDPVFGPGLTVSVDLGGIGGAFGTTDLADRAKTQLTSYLQTRGVKVADGAPVRIVGSVSGGKSETYKYQVIGVGVGAGEREFSATFVQQNLQMQLLDSAGKPLWESKTTSTYGGGGYSSFGFSRFGGGNTIPEGKTGPQHIQEQEQQTHKRSIESFFLGQRLPYMLYPQPKDANDQPGMGQTMINISEYSRPSRSNPIARATPGASGAQLASSEMYAKLLDADRATWIQHWQWCSELERPLVALRWGLGVQMDLPSNRASEELQPKPADAGNLRDLERITGAMGPSLVQLLRSKSTEGKFGTFVGSSEKDLREVTILGAGERAQLAAAARKATVDVVLIIKIDAVNSGKLKDSKMQLQMVDMASTKKLWESEFLLSSKVAEAKIKGKDPTTTLINAAEQYLDTTLVLEPIDAIPRDKALQRVTAGTLHRANQLASLCEVMLYESRDLITTDSATTAYSKVLGNATDAATLAGNDLAARQAIIKKYINNWQTSAK